MDILGLSVAVFALNERVFFDVWSHKDSNSLLSIATMLLFLIL